VANKILKIKTWRREPTLRQTAVVQKFVRGWLSEYLRSHGSQDISEAFEIAERLLDHARSAGEPDVFEAAIRYYETGVLPEIVTAPVPSAPAEKLKPLSGLAESTNSVDEEDEAMEPEPAQTVVPVAGEETPEPEPNEEDLSFEAAVDAAAGEEEDAS
jgi:hypothetical protein